MQIPRKGVVRRLLAVLALSTATMACGGPSKDGASKDGANEQKAAPPPVIEAKAVVDEGKAAAADDAAAAAEGGTGAADDAGGSGPGPAATSGGPAASGGPVEAGATGSGGEEAAAETTGGTVDVPALLKEIKNKRTKDARAQAAVAEAVAAGADPAALAKALNSRGEALFADPDRAKVFFELANETDPKATAPAFNLAKQAAVVGELDEAKKWLTVVRERKGKKLLKQIDFDPMWEILKDDPDVRALLK